MLGINNKLRELEEKKTPIRVSLVGAGLMGKGLVSQMSLMKGMIPALVVSRRIESAIEAYTLAGIKKEDIVVARSLEEVNVAMEQQKFVVSDRNEFASRANLIDVVVDATGGPDTGAQIAMETVLNKKHIVMLNVEADVVVGPILNKLAKNAGVVYTGTAGDEPGTVKEIYDFADASGFDVLAIGKGKNNKIDYAATPDSVMEEALRKGLKPSMLACFVDGTKTMVEMTAMANATGFIPDIRGGHGPASDVKGLPEIFRLKEEGGILNQYGIVEYVRGVAPGVFVIVTSKLPQVHHEMQFLSMGPGPNYVLYRPYHLTSLETPMSVANAFFYNQATIAPLYDKPVAETITIAKKDLKAGERFDGIGEYTVYGSVEVYEKAKEENLLPIGLINENTVAKQDIKKGEFITYDMVELDKTTMIYKLRQLQESI